MPSPSRKRAPRTPAAPPGSLPPDLEELLRDSGFADPAAARQRVLELYRDNAELLALARLSGTLRDALADCPDPDAGILHLSRFVEVRGSRLQLYSLFLDHPALLDRFVRVVSSSRYLADVLVRTPSYLSILNDSALLSKPRTLAQVKADVDGICASVRTEAEKLDAMRRLHRREVLRIGAADLLGFQDLPAVTRQISDLADAFVSKSLSIVSSPAARAGLIVVALGKWGGQELNYSSDIDVVFLARRSGDVTRLTPVVRRLIAALSQPTFEGVVYRVDLRLRPYGSEGSLVSPAAMFADYLRTRAKPAERQMMLKARAAAGDLAGGRRLLARIVPVILSDAPSARPQVRRLKSRIEQLLHERGQADGHVKLAPGGIRDVEFLVQALQLEAGLSRRDVLGGNTLEALRTLEKAGRLPADDADTLREAYLFLRAVEHRMQLMGNQQVYRLPRRREDLARLGRTMGLGTANADDRLLDAYDARTRTVRSIFDRILGSSTAREISAAAPESATAQSLRRQMGGAAARIDSTLFRKCAELLDSVGPADPVRVIAEKHDRRWTLVAAAVDAKGTLPLVAGLLASRRANILSGDFQRLRFEKPAARKTLSVFEVELSSEAPATFGEDVRREISELVALAAGGQEEAARQRVLDAVADTLRASEGTEVPLLPLRIETRNDADPARTELRIYAPDTLGFLFEFTTALASLRVEVDSAVVRTVEDEVFDTFWVTDAEGRKIGGDRALDELRVAAALVKQFTHLLPRSPNPSQALRQFTAMLHQMLARPEWVPQLRDLESPSVLTAIAELMGVSRYLWEDFLLLQHENLFPVVVSAPALKRPRSRVNLERELTRRLGPTSDPAEALARLNEFKDREMFRVGLRHITRRGDFPELMSSLSDLAEVVIGRAAELCAQRLAARHGVPRRSDGEALPWAVVALGKLGGRELGLASDLDLLIAYDGEGTSDGADSLPASSWFIEFVKMLLQSLKARREGSFEIDLRLRPYGDAGALATSLDGFVQYFSDSGAARPFERMALVKLRPVAGDRALGERLLEARDAFVYSTRPLDLENILHLRGRQAAELVPAGRVNAKYSPGGLVDLEYGVQSLQIAAGARAANLRVPNTLEAVDRLVRAGRLRGGVASEIAGAYLFLRRLIDALRVVRGNAKDSNLPAGPSREFAYLVRRLDYLSAARLESEIRQRMSFARNLWKEMRVPL